MRQKRLSNMTEGSRRFCSDGRSSSNRRKLVPAATIDHYARNLRTQTDRWIETIGGANLQAQTHTQIDTRADRGTQRRTEFARTHSSARNNHGRTQRLCSSVAHHRCETADVLSESANRSAQQTGFQASIQFLVMQMFYCIDDRSIPHRSQPFKFPDCHADPATLQCPRRCTDATG